MKLFKGRTDMAIESITTEIKYDIDKKIKGMLYKKCYVDKKLSKKIGKDEGIYYTIDNIDYYFKANDIIKLISDIIKEVILNQGNITDIEAIHALSASRLGNQYVFKTEKALNKINFLERLYCSSDERKDSMLSTIDRKNVIDTKLRLAKREFRNQGVYIDEVFK